MKTRFTDLTLALLCSCSLGLLGAACSDDSQTPSNPSGQGGSAGSADDASSLAGSMALLDGAPSEGASTVDATSGAGDSGAEGGSGGCRQIPADGGGNADAATNAILRTALPLPPVRQP